MAGKIYASSLIQSNSDNQRIKSREKKDDKEDGDERNVTLLKPELIIN